MTANISEASIEAQESERARLSLRHPISSVGQFDGAWWPRTKELLEELPLLMRALWTEMPELDRVNFHPGTWVKPPPKLHVDGRLVRTGVANSNPLTVRLSDPWNRMRIDLIVIPPDTGPDVAASAMGLASRSDCADSPTDVMARAAHAA